MTYFKKFIYHLLRKNLKRFIIKILKILEIPGTLYSDGHYQYIHNATIFPTSNIHMLKIADNNHLHDAFFNIWEQITLEEGVILGHQVMFLTGKHEVDNIGAQKEPSVAGKILVCKNALIGSRAMILGGVTIGKGSVIGAGSIVTKSVPDHQFWAGNPARFVRSLE